MSMLLSVTKFEKQGDRLDAAYSTLSREVLVTEFINSLILEKYILDFAVFEDDEEVKYREISKESIAQLSSEIDNIADRLFKNLQSVSGKSKREEIISNIQDINLLNHLIKIFLFNQGENDSSTIRILIS